MKYKTEDLLCLWQQVFEKEVFENKQSCNIKEYKQLKEFLNEQKENIKAEDICNRLLLQFKK